MQEQWVIPCRDFAGRQRYTLVAVTDDGNVAMVTPPGGSATCAPADVVTLREVLRVALVSVGQGGEH